MDKLTQEELKYVWDILHSYKINLMNDCRAMGIDPRACQGVTRLYNIQVKLEPYIHEES